jgi:hypothetical protein
VATEAIKEKSTSTDLVAPVWQRKIFRHLNIILCLARNIQIASVFASTRTRMSITMIEGLYLVNQAISGYCIVRAVYSAVLTEVINYILMQLECARLAGPVTAKCTHSNRKRFDAQ